MGGQPVFVDCCAQARCLGHRVEAVFVGREFADAGVLEPASWILKLGIEASTWSAASTSIGPWIACGCTPTYCASARAAMRFICPIPPVWIMSG